MVAPWGTRTPHAVFRLHVASVWAMVGVIWIVQRLHYPMMAFVGADQFVQMHHFHTAGITPLVGPTMVVELATGVILAAHQRTWVWAVAVGLTSFCFALTFLGAVPLHHQLAEGFAAGAHTELLAINQWRTWAWTLHGLLMLFMWPEPGPTQARLR